MASTITENENLAEGEFTPFNDTNVPRVQKAVKLFVSSTQGYDTSQIDRFRQGVSIRRSKHLYSSLQPKMWAGNLEHATNITTYGQARSFTEFEDSKIFEELPEFNPVWYTDSIDTYPFPVVFNEGPQEQEETSVEPFTIPFKKEDNTFTFFPRSPKAALEDGNGFDDLQGGVNRVEQFVSYDPPSTARFFLDEGQEYFGGVFKPNFLDTTFQPVALYQLTNLNFVDKTGNNADLENVDPANPVVLDRPGPFPNTFADPDVVFFDGANNYLSASSDTTSATQLRGAMTGECFFFYDGPPGGSGAVFAQAGSFSDSSPPTNVLYTVVIQPGANQVRYLHQHSSGSAITADFGFNGNFLSGSWNHVAITRRVATGSMDVTCYLNGVHLGTQATTPPTGGEDTAIVIGNAAINDGSATEEWQGGIASVKIINRELSAAEVKSEADRLLKPTYNDSSIIIEGFSPIIQREITPFNDTKNESIVESINTTDANFKSELKKLDFDLSEDIRGTFRKKSATAGGEVYGPDAAIYGTDSIAYRGTTRGA